jgi:hypothetical protein
MREMRTVSQTVVWVNESPNAGRKEKRQKKKDHGLAG